MASQYDAVATRALSTITKKGAPVLFATGGSSASIYNPLTDTWSGGSPASVTGRAVQIDGDPNRFAALGLELIDPVTLLVAAKELGFTPAPGMGFTWAGVSYTIKDANDTGPDGVPILWTITGSR